MSYNAHAQRGYVRDAVRDKEYKEHGADGESKLNGWLGNLTDVKVARSYEFPMYMQMHTKSYKNGKVKDETDMNMYVNAAKSTFGVMMFKEKKGEKKESVFSVYDYKNNNSILFDMKEKTYMAFNMNAFMSKENQAKRETGNAKVNTNVDCKKTGRTKTIHGYKCVEFVCTYENSGDKHEYWVTTSLPYTMSQALANTMKQRYTGNTSGMNGAILEEYDYRDGELVREMTVTELNPSANYKFATTDYKYNGIGEVHFYD